MIIMIIIIMIVHHHNHVSGPGVVSSGSRSRTVFRGASRDFHPRPNSQVFVIFSITTIILDFHHHYLHFKRISSLFWGLTNIQIFCQHLGYCDVGPFWSLYYVIDIFIFPGTSCYHLPRYIDSQNADGSYTYGFEVLLTHCSNILKFNIDGAKIQKEYKRLEVYGPYGPDF